MNSINERAPGERGAEELRLFPNTRAHHTTARSCRGCGWVGHDREIRIIEHWTRSSPGYWTIRLTYPCCPAQIERR
jgi:hypothetical protein